MMIYRWGWARVGKTDAAARRSEEVIRLPSHVSPSKWTEEATVSSQKIMINMMHVVWIGSTKGDDDQE